MPEHSISVSADARRAMPRQDPPDHTFRKSI
jgi:hypothetical protein